MGQKQSSESTSKFVLIPGFYKGSGKATNDTGYKYDSPSYQLLFQTDGNLVGKSLYFPTRVDSSNKPTDICPLKGSWKKDGEVTLIETWRGSDWVYRGKFNGKKFKGKWHLPGNNEKKNRGIFEFRLNETTGFSSWNISVVLVSGVNYVGDGIAINQMGVEYHVPKQGYKFSMKPNQLMTGSVNYVERFSSTGEIGKIAQNCPIEGRWNGDGTMEWTETYLGHQYTYKDGQKLMGRWWLSKGVVQPTNKGAFVYVMRTLNL